MATVADQVNPDRKPELAIQATCAQETRKTYAFQTKLKTQCFMGWTKTVHQRFFSKTPWGRKR
jgi:hypothetical protein